MHGNHLFRTCFGLTLAVLFPLSLPLPAQTAEQEAQQHYVAARQAQESGNLDLAAQEYQKASRLLPNVAEVWASLGMVYNAQGKFAESAQALSKAEKLKPGLRGVSLYLGIDEEKQRLAGAAVPHFVEAVRQEPQNKEAHTWLGRALWDDEKIPQALEQIRKNTELFPAEPALLLDLGVAYRKAADIEIERVLSGASGTPLVHQVYGDIYRDDRAWENAAAHYYRALEQDPHWQGAHFGLGEIALHREKLDVATQEFQRELEINPKSAAALARLGEIALLANQPEEALSRLNEAARASNDQAASALGLPHAYPIGSQDLGDPAKAQLRAVQPALETSAPSAGRTLALAFVHARLGGDEPPAPSKSLLSSAKHLESWAELHPTDFAAQYALARTYRNLSLETLEQLLATAPDSYPAHELQAETYQNQEQDAKALDEYRVVETMAPNLSGVHFAIGHLLLKTNQQDQAREELEAELRLNPDHPEANAEMGTLLVERQDAKNAIPYLEKAVQLSPNLWDTYQQLGRAYYAEKEYAKAEVALKQAVRHDPRGLAHYQLALVYRSMGQKEAANAQFEISRKLKLESLTHDENQMKTLTSIPQ
jgi:tetratricopeptide (TPR) repeat protein